ncbi:MAG: hypothetical protein AABY22_00735 [Nanoarchaeota archaeon]
MPKTKTRDITILAEKDTFSLFKRSKGSKDEFDFRDIAALRHLLSNEKARLLSIVKTQNPDSIYDLAKKSNRSFKSVFQDVKLLERFGLLEMTLEKKNNRKRLKPSVVVDNIIINIKF